MPRLRKYIENGSVMFVTSRTEEGMPFDPFTAPELPKAFLAIMARAQFLYPVHIIAFILMGNHFHLMLVAQNPEDVPKFVGYLKQELAYLVNRLNRRRKKTVWCEGYDSPLLLTLEDAAKYLNYIFQQPLEPGISMSLDSFPGTSSWNMFQEGATSLECERVYRVKKNKNDEATKESLQLVVGLKPLLDSLDSSVNEQVFREKVIKKAKEDEAISAPLKVVSIKNLDSYVPQKFGRRTVCICSDKEMRKLFLSAYKRLCEAAAEALKNWRTGSSKPLWPPGMFPPCHFTFSSALRGAAVRI